MKSRNQREGQYIGYQKGHLHLGNINTDKARFKPNCMSSALLVQLRRVKKLDPGL